MASFLRYPMFFKKIRSNIILTELILRAALIQARMPGGRENMTESCTNKMDD